jgi:pimeloyl-ACP methyl ester carboxylesterase
MGDESNRRPVVLVPGACLGGWAWRDVAGRLRELGHETYPLTLTGLGERSHLASREVDLETHIADVVGVLDFENLKDVVLVGHSYGGTVITGVADRRPERLDGLVYLDTSPLPDGTAIVDVQTPEQRIRQRAEVDLRGDGWLWPPPDRDTLSSGVYGSASGLRPEHLSLLQARATAQPYASFTTPLHLSASRPETMRRVAIFCSEGGPSVALVRELIVKADPRANGFADPDWELHELPTGHWSMLSLPGALAQLLHRIASADHPPRRA